MAEHEDDLKPKSHASHAGAGHVHAPAAGHGVAVAGAADAHGEHHGIAHVTPMKLLIGVFAALVVLTVVTVAVRSIDLGGQMNLVVAMIIASIKAGLVVTYFMHLRWDRTFNVLLFLSSLLFMILFLAMALTDRQEYQPNIDMAEEAQTEQTGS